MTLGIKNQWRFDPDQLIGLVEVLFSRLTKRQWRLLALLYSPEERKHRWMVEARREFIMTQPQVRWMREDLEHKLIGHLMEAYILACQERDGKLPSALEKDSHWQWIASKEHYELNRDPSEAAE